MQHLNGEIEQKSRQRAELERTFSGIIGELLADPDITEVLVNPDGRVYADRIRIGMMHVGHMEPLAIMNAIRTVAGAMRQTINAEQPCLQGTLPIDGSRIHAWIPPVVLGPTLAIRRHRHANDQGFTWTIDHFLQDGTLPQAYYPHLIHAIKKRLNVIIVGGTTSGKTTLGIGYLDLISKLCPDDRIITIEDTRELACRSENVISLLATPQVSMRKLLQQSLRARPDRIIFGEVRDEAAHDLLMAWNTAHNGGFCTLHANNVEDAFDRLEGLAEFAGYPVSPKRISRTVHFLLSMSNEKGVRTVKELAYVRGWENGTYLLEHISPIL